MRNIGAEGSFKDEQARKMAARGETPEKISATLGLTLAMARIICALYAPKHQRL